MCPVYYPVLQLYKGFGEHYWKVWVQSQLGNYLSYVHWDMGSHKHECLETVAFGYLSLVAIEQITFKCLCSELKHLCTNISLRDAGMQLQPVTTWYHCIVTCWEHKSWHNKHVCPDRRWPVQVLITTMLSIGIQTPLPGNHTFLSYCRILNDTLGHSKLLTCQRQLNSSPSRWISQTSIHTDGNSRQEHRYIPMSSNIFSPASNAPGLWRQQLSRGHSLLLLLGGAAWPVRVSMDHSPAIWPLCQGSWQQ